MLQHVMPRLFDKRTTFLLLIMSLPLLFLPKINLVGFIGQTAGIRIDDFVLLGFSVVFFWGSFSLRNRLYNIESIIFLIVGFSIISFLLNRLFVSFGILHVNASIFYCFRIFEYFLFFYVGIFASRFFSLSSILGAFLLWNVLLMGLQKMGIIGAFTSAGYMTKFTDRILGVASFGSEIGLLLNIVFAYLLFQDKKIKNLFGIYISGNARQFVNIIYPYLLLLLFVYLVVLSGARMALVSLVVCFFVRLKDLIRWNSPATFIIPICTIVLAALLMTYAIYTHSTIIKRSTGLFSANNVTLVTTVWNSIPIDQEPVGKESIEHDESNDKSWWMRIHKWCYALKIYCLNPECWLQGVGPGFAMAALDGAYLRILTEMGLIGCVLYGWLFYLIYKNNPALKGIMIAVFLNMLFFDVYLAYKPMSLLFLITGYAYTERSTAADHTP